MTVETHDFEILVRGNLLAKQYAKEILGRRKLNRFMTAMLYPSRAHTLKISEENLKKIQAIPAEDRDAILETQKVVDCIFSNYERLAYNVAKRMSGAIHNQSDVSQIESEAKVGLLKAIRGYTKLSIKFITYAYRAIFHEVSRYLQRSGSSLSGINFTLLVKYKKKLEELTQQNVPHSFDDVCSALNITKKGQILRLRMALRAQVTSENELEEEIAGILVDNRRKTSVDLDFIRALAAVPLSALEKDSWLSQNRNVRSLFPDSFGSQREVAQHYGVTTQAVSAAAQRAKKKLATSLRDFDPSV